MYLKSQPIVFAAGLGMKLSVLTSCRSKALLPVGTLPMIYYPLYFLQEAGFEEATVIAKNEIASAISRLEGQYGLKIKLDVVPVDVSDDLGTADSFRLIAPKIKRNISEVIIISSDLITDMKLQTLLNEHRVKGAALTSFLADLNVNANSVVVPGPKIKSFNRILEAAPQDEYDELVQTYNTSLVNSRFQNSSLLDSRVCYAYHYAGFCLRANSMKAYWYLNQKIKEWYENVCPASTWSLRPLSAKIHENAQINNESVIGDGVVISEKTNINNSTIGNHSRINPMVRIRNSLIADHVSIASNCVIEGSIIFANIEKKCSIKNCIVTDSSVVEENKTYSNEVLETVQDMYDDIHGY